MLLRASSSSSAARWQRYVPASTAETNQTYQVIDFNGKPRPIAQVTIGGPCGTPQAAPH